MTTATQINTLAEHAAGAAVDAFGKIEVPAATTAYSFIFQQAYEDVDGPMPPQLTSREFRKFRHDYCRWLRILGVTSVTAMTAAFSK